MILTKIKEDVISKKGKRLQFKFNGARNQTEEFTGIIIETYPGIFLIQTDSNQPMVKSFSYTDVLTLHLEIKEDFN